jgi:hypothetical protein
MCYTGKCAWEGADGTCDTNISHCPTDMEKPCECGSRLKQLQEDEEYHCMNCDKIIY